MKKRTNLLLALLTVTFLNVSAQFRPMFDEKYPDVHDPVMAKGEDGRYYIFSTGMRIGVMSSADMKTWKMEPSVLAETPAWAMDSVPGYKGHTWAPDIYHHNGKWYLYYSCSTFGKNGSAIGVATNKTLDPKSPDFRWEDQGAVIVSHRHKDNWNAIDPNVAIDKKTGSPYLVYGSFWDGLQLIKLDTDMKTPLTQPKTIARRIGRKLSIKDLDKVENFEIEGGDTIEAGENAIEAPFIIYRKGWYYLFVSWDYCCRGQKSTYKTMYGRSRNIEGPYVDKSGQDMARGGGELLVGPDSRFYGVGHCSAYEFGGKWYFLSHAYDSQVNARAKLFLRPLVFDRKGWMKLK